MFVHSPIGGKLVVVPDVEASGSTVSDNSVSTGAVPAMLGGGLCAVDDPVAVTSDNAEGASLDAVTLGLTSGVVGFPGVGKLVLLAADWVDGTVGDSDAPGNLPNHSRSREHAAKLLEQATSTTQRCAETGFLQGTPAFATSLETLQLPPTPQPYEIHSTQLQK